MAEQPQITRVCPQHLSELVFRPLSVRGGGIGEVPWCGSPHSHVPERWLVRDESGRVWAEATLTGYTPYFDVDQLFEQWLASEAGREVAVPHSQRVAEVA